LRLKRPEKRQDVGSYDSYYWRVHWNLGNGQFSTPYVRYQPLPLEANTGDTALGGATKGYSGLLHGYEDFDGDGYLDAIINCAYDGTYCLAGLDENGDRMEGSYYQVFRGDGLGHFLGDATGRALVWQLPIPGPLSWPIPGGSGLSRSVASWADLTDVNGDGLPDYVRMSIDGSGQPAAIVFYNNGKGFSLGPKLVQDSIPAITNSLIRVLAPTSGLGRVQDAERRFGRRFVDVDGDRLVDLVEDKDTSFSVHRNTGDLLLTGTVSLDAAWSGALRRLVKIGNDSWLVDEDWLDVDGDGRPDRVRAGTELRSESPTTAAPRLLTTIANGRGRVVTFSYASSNDAAVVLQTHGRSAAPTWVVKSVVVNHGFSQTQGTTTYRYEEPVFNKDPRERWGFRGFEKMVETSPLGGRTTSVFDYSLDYSGRLVSRVKDLGSDSSTLSVVDTTWVEKSLFAGAVRTYHGGETRTYSCSGAETAAACRAAVGRLRRETSTYEVRAEGVVVERTTEEGLSATAATGDRIFETDVEVESSATRWRVRVTAQRAKERSSSGSLDLFARERTLFNADGLPYQVERYRDAVTYTKERTTYDGTPGAGNSTGSPVLVESPRFLAEGLGPKTTFGYDAYRIFATSTQNALGHTYQTEYDLATGAVTKRIDANYKLTCVIGGSCTVHRPEERIVIDGFARPRERWVSFDAALGYQSVLVERAYYYDFTTPNYVRTEKLKDVGGTEWVRVDERFDGSGRLLGQTTYRFGEGPGGDAIVSYGYDPEGHLVLARVPDPTNDTLTVDYTMQYDAAGRPRHLYGPENLHTELTYGLLSKTTTEVAADGTGAVTSEAYDARGRLIQVSEWMGGSSWANTVYQYDAADRTKQITNADGIVTQLGHDWLGRRTSVMRGTRQWKYGYDDNGNMVSETVPHATGLDTDYTTTTFYDELDRPRSRKPGPRGQDDATWRRLGIGETRWSYDQGTNGIGRVTGVEQYGGQLGQPTQEVSIKARAGNRAGAEAVPIA
jgi:YD repeat-containing protein